MDDPDQFIEFVNNVCRRPHMYTLNGTFGEVAAIFTGIEIASSHSLTNDDQKQTLHMFVTSRLHVPGKYWWPGAIQIVSLDDDTAISLMRDLLVEFTTLRKTKSLAEIRELAATAASQYKETEPAKTWRRFLAARYTADRAQIEPLIMPHRDADILWRRNPMPVDVAAQLNSISDSYVVSVVAGSMDSGQVTLITELGKIDAYLVENSWRIDATPIIAIDKRNA